MIIDNVQYNNPVRPSSSGGSSAPTHPAFLPTISPPGGFRRRAVGPKTINDDVRNKQDRTKTNNHSRPVRGSSFTTAKTHRHDDHVRHCPAAKSQRDSQQRVTNGSNINSSTGFKQTNIGHPSIWVNTAKVWVGKNNDKSVTLFSCLASYCPELI